VLSCNNLLSGKNRGLLVLPIRIPKGINFSQRKEGGNRMRKSGSQVQEITKSATQFDSRSGEEVGCLIKTEKNRDGFKFKPSFYLELGESR